MTSIDIIIQFVFSLWIKMTVACMLTVTFFIVEQVGNHVFCYAQRYEIRKFQIIFSSVWDFSFFNKGLIFILLLINFRHIAYNFSYQYIVFFFLLRTDID